MQRAITRNSARHEGAPGGGGEQRALQTHLEGPIASTVSSAAPVKRQAAQTGRLGIAQRRIRRPRPPRPRSRGGHRSRPPSPRAARGRGTPSGLQGTHRSPAPGRDSLPAVGLWREAGVAVRPSCPKQQHPERRCSCPPMFPRSSGTEFVTDRPPSSIDLSRMIVDGKWASTRRYSPESAPGAAASPGAHPVDAERARATCCRAALCPAGQPSPALRDLGGLAAASPPQPPRPRLRPALLSRPLPPPPPK